MHHKDYEEQLSDVETDLSFQAQISLCTVKIKHPRNIQVMDSETKETKFNLLV